MIHFEFTMQRRHLVALLAIVVTTALLIPGVAWASNQFTDVPDSNTFHNDISWMADAGITKGCNPPANDKFCPGDSVTREQMAAFMHRLADNKVVDAATAVDSDKLDGLDSTDFAPSDMIGTSIMTVMVQPTGTPYDGTLNGPTGVTRTDTGKYTVTFDRDVTSCVPATNDLQWINNRDVSASPVNGEPNEILVQVRNHDDTLYVDTHWSMIVVCPEGAEVAGLQSGSANTP